MTSRRQLLLAAGLSAISRAVFGQATKKPWRIGVVGAGPRLTPENLKTRPAYAGLLAGLRDLGFAEGIDFVMAWRFTGSASYDGMDALAAELVKGGVDLIATANPNASHAARKATSSIPIVFFSGHGDPVALGLVKSLARPGGNVTGFSNRSDELVVKQLDTLRMLIPGLARVAVLTNPKNPSHPGFVEAMKKAAASSSVNLLLTPIPDLGQLEEAFAGFAKRGAQAFISLGDVEFLVTRARIVNLVRRYRLPSAFINREYIEEGGLLQYGWDQFQDAKRVAVYMRKILHEGAKPADLPVEQSSNIKLVLNRKAATELGLKFPQELLLRADEVIE